MWFTQATELLSHGDGIVLQQPCASSKKTLAPPSDPVSTVAEKKRAFHGAAVARPHHLYWEIKTNGGLKSQNNI